jgi:hypothetical protein
METSHRHQGVNFMDVNTYDVLTPPAIHCLSPEVDRYREEDVRCLPITFVQTEEHQYVLIVSTNTPQKTLELKVKVPEVIGASDCIDKCKNVLGLKINEIAKLVGISRATLDLHKKGSPVKNMEPYERLYAFASNVEDRYATNISKGIRNILVKRKTLAQHLVANKEDLSACIEVVDEVATKLGHINLIKTDIDESKANLRLSGIGRMA